MNPGDSGRFDDERQMWRVSLAMYIAGALALLLILVVPEPDHSDHDELLAIALVMLGLAGVIWAVGPRPLANFLWYLVGLVAVSAVVAVARPLGATAFFYLWPILTSAYHLEPRRLWIALGVFYVTYAGSLALGDQEQPAMILWVGGAASFTVAALIVNRLKRRLVAALEEQRRTAGTDSLTGLLNRRAFEAAFDRELERARRYGAQLTLILLDLDRFKLVNDGFGHAVGDDVLRAFAAALADARRGGDLVARVGGEEFAVVLPDTGVEGARAFVDRIAAAAATAQTAAGPQTLSAGIVALDDDHAGREALMLAADRALYAAKDAGRARAVVAR